MRDERTYEWFIDSGGCVCSPGYILERVVERHQLLSVVISQWEEGVYERGGRHRAKSVLACIVHMFSVAGHGQRGEQAIGVGQGGVESHGDIVNTHRGEIDAAL